METEIRNIYKCMLLSGINVLKYINVQDEELCKLAIERNPVSFIDVKNQTYELALLAVKNDGRLIKYVNDEFKTVELCENAIYNFYKSEPKFDILLNYIPIYENLQEQFSGILQFIKNQTLHLCVMAINYNWQEIEFVNDQTEQLIEMAYENYIEYAKMYDIFNEKNNNIIIGNTITIKPNNKIIKNYNFLEKIKNPSYNLISLFLKENWRNVKYTNDEKLIYLAIESYKNEFNYNQTTKLLSKNNDYKFNFNEELININYNDSLINCCFVSCGGFNKSENNILQYTKNPSYEIIKEILSINGKELKYVNEQQTEELCKIAILNNPMSYIYSKFKILHFSENECISIIKKNGLFLKYIDKLLQTKKLCKIALTSNSHSLKYINIDLFDIDECPVCHENKHIINYPCIGSIKHIICLDCYCKNKKCYYRCNIIEEID